MTLRSRLIFAYAVLAVAATFVEAVYRLLHRAAAALDGRLDARLGAALAVSVAVFTWFEGHRALQGRFVPHVVERGLGAGRALQGCFPVLLAPLYALSLYRAPARSMARAWAGIAAIVCAVLVVRQLPEPWRAVVDAGVAAALAWGGVALLRAAASAGGLSAGGRARPAGLRAKP